MVILTDETITKAIILNEECRKLGIAFIMANTYGLLGAIFCDFGPNFVVNDATGEEPLTGLIGGITRVRIQSCINFILLF